MWVHGRVQQNSPLRLWKRDVEVLMVGEKMSGRWHWILHFLPEQPQPLKWYEQSLCDDPQSNMSTISILPNSSTWRPNYTSNLACAHKPIHVLSWTVLCPTSDDGLSPSPYPDSTSGSHSHFSAHPPDSISHSALLFLFLSSLLICATTPQV